MLSHAASVPLVTAIAIWLWGCATTAAVGQDRVTDANAITAVRGCLHREQSIRTVGGLCTHIRFVSEDEMSLHTSEPQEQRDGFSVVRVRFHAAPPKLWWEAALLDPGLGAWVGTRGDDTDPWLSTFDDGETSTTYYPHLRKAYVQQQDWYAETMGLVPRVGMMLMMGGNSPVTHAEALSMPAMVSESQQDCAQRLGIDPDASAMYLTYEGKATIESIDCIQVLSGYQRPDGGHTERRAWISPQHGFAPVRIETRNVIPNVNGPPVSLHFVQSGADWREAVNGIWVPSIVYRVACDSRFSPPCGWSMVDVLRYDELTVNQAHSGLSDGFPIPLGTYVIRELTGESGSEGDTIAALAEALRLREQVFEESIELVTNAPVAD